MGRGVTLVRDIQRICIVMADEVYDLIKTDITSIVSRRCHGTTDNIWQHAKTGASASTTGQQKWKRHANGTLISIVLTGSMVKKHLKTVPDTSKDSSSSKPKQ